MGKNITIFPIFFLFLIIFSISVYSLDECAVLQPQDKIPCKLLLPYNGNCTTHSIYIYDNNTILLSTTKLNNLIGNSSFMCYSIFNYTNLGTYIFNYTTGDTGSLTVEEGNMNFFNLLVYIVFFGISILFIYFMHRWEENIGASIAYGWFSATFSIFAGAMIFSGFSIVKGVSFIFDLNYYIGALFFAIALYSISTTIKLKKANSPKKEEYYG